MDIVLRLKMYSKNCLEVEAIQRRINSYKEMLGGDMLDCLDNENLMDPTMPKAKNSKSSIVETLVLATQQREQDLRSWVAADLDKLFWVKLEVQEIERALAKLTDHQQYIIRNKYWDVELCTNNEDETTWKTIEERFYTKFGILSDYQGLKKRFKKAIAHLELELNEFYERHNDIYT